MQCQTTPAMPTCGADEPAHLYTKHGGTSK